MHAGTEKVESDANYVDHMVTGGISTAPPKFTTNLL